MPRTIVLYICFSLSLSLSIELRLWGFIGCRPLLGLSLGVLGHGAQWWPIGGVRFHWELGVSVAKKEENYIYEYLYDVLPKKKKKKSLWKAYLKSE